MKLLVDKLPGKDDYCPVMCVCPSMFSRECPKHNKKYNKKECRGLKELNFDEIFKAELDNLREDDLK